MKTFEFIWPLSWGDWIESCARYTGISEMTLEDMIVEEVEVSEFDLAVTLSGRNRPDGEYNLYEVLDWAYDNALDTGYTT